MPDDEIRGLLHTLEEDRIPDPAFADHLYLRLTAVRRRPARRWPLVLLAAAALVALAGGAALGSGLLNVPTTAETTPTASASITSTPAPTPAPTRTESATPSAAASSSPERQTPVAAPTPYAQPQNVLPPGGLVAVRVDGLRIRQQPSAASESVATIRRGEILYLDDGHAGPGKTIPPVRAEGFDWYQVMFAAGHRDWPIMPARDDIVHGWVARGPASTPFIDLAAPRCPEGIELADLVTVTAYERVACLGGQQLSIVGTFGCPACDSLSYSGVWEPRWLAGYFTIQHMFALSWESYAATSKWPPFIILAWPPEQPRPPEDDLRGNVLRVTGHLSDARAADCTIASEVDGEQVVSDPEASEWYCRTLFVVEEWEIVGTDPDFDRDPS